MYWWWSLAEEIEICVLKQAWLMCAACGPITVQLSIGTAAELQQLLRLLANAINHN